MGNCLKSCRKSRSAVAAADEIEVEDTYKHSQSSGMKAEQEFKPSDRSSGETVYDSSKEVKIKMTKKELTELFKKVEQQGMHVGEVLAELLENRAAVDGGGHGGGDEVEMRRQKSWRPMLQSIPEIDQWR